MHHVSGYIAVGNEQLHYLRAGSGSKLLLAFPGYGHDGSSLLWFEPYLKEQYTCLFIDLPHHGKSQWQPGTTFTRAQLKDMCLALARQYHVDKLSLLGFSMGGRVCLTIIEELPHMIDMATLIASDGLARNRYYTFFTRTLIGRKLFMGMLADPRPYARVIAFLKDRKWITEWQHKFVSYYISSDAIRRQLSLVWPAMSLLMPVKSRVLAAIQQHNITIHLFMGRYDKVIPAALGQRFAEGAKTVHLHILDRGHHIIDAGTAPQIAQTLL